MRVERDYDVPPRELLAVLTDERFLAERGARYGGSGAPTVRRSGEVAVVTIPRQLPVDAVPAVFRPFVGSGALVQTDIWSQVADGLVAGSWNTDVGDSPLQLSGTQEITAIAGGCRYVFTADVKVNIPFVGGKAQGMVSDQLAELVGKEQQFAADWLAGRAGRGPSS